MGGYFTHSIKASSTRNPILSLLSTPVFIILRKMGAFKYFVLFLVAFLIASCQGEIKGLGLDDTAQFAAPDLDREYSVVRPGSLYALPAKALLPPQNGSFGSLEAGASARQARPEGEVQLELRPKEVKERSQREMQGPVPRSSASRVKKQQRYLPYSPSFGKSSFLPDDLQGLMEEKLIYRQSRAAGSKAANRKKTQRTASADHPAIFSYDVDLALNFDASAGATQPQSGNGQSAGGSPGDDSAPNIFAFDIALPDMQLAEGPKQPDRSQFQRAMGPAMRGARQDFLAKVANQRPNQCLVGPETRKNPSLIWTVGKVSEFTRFAYQNEFAGRRLADQLTDGNADHLFASLDRDGIDQSKMGEEGDCFADSDIECDGDSPFRTFDGTCNNLHNPLQGSANSPQSRLGPADYQDGISEPRRLSVASRIQNRQLLLPSTREVSAAISQNLDRESKKITYMFNQFGQFIAHDITNTPVEKIPDPENPKNSITPKCCGVDPSCIHPACYPISIPQNDRVYGQFGIQCLEFVRSQPAAKSGCRLGARIPLNAVTSYIDGSQIYGSKASDADRIRSKRRGLLRTNDSPIAMKQNLVMLPGGDNAQGCIAPSPDKKCVDAGDLRANQHTGLVAIHSLFLRLHNQIASFISSRKPHSSDESVFQQTRKIVGAIQQHIYFKEMLPIIVGKKIVSEPRNGLALTKEGYCDCYEEDLDATMQVEFAAGAYRFHTLQDNTLPVHDDNGVEYPFYQHFGNPNMWYKPGILDELLKNLAGKPAEAFDPQFAAIFQSQVFKPVNKPTGIDMLAFNNQRGRDHGVPGFVKMREICGLSAVKTFKDLERLMPKEAVDNLASIYRHVRDIDFYAGGISEKAVNKDGLVGATFACVLSDQFRRLKNGDRFWYENEGVFSADQLKELRKVSMAALLCGNSAEITEIQPKPFQIPSDSNPVTPCDDILARTSMRLDPFLQGLPRV